MKLNLFVYREVLKDLYRNRTSLFRLVVILGLFWLGLFSITVEHNGWTWIICRNAYGRYLATLLKSVGPEIAGIFIGVVTIDYFNEKRQEQQRKEQLVIQMGSKYNEIADSAVEELNRRNWGFYKEKTLVNAELAMANLEGAYLGRANLKNATLFGANLEGASLRGADLSRANLDGANLQGANLRLANLYKTTLGAANLGDARLGEANLSGANLYISDLRRAKLSKATLIKTDLRNAFALKANLIMADLRGADLRGTNLSRANLIRANLLGASLKGADLNGARLWRCLVDPWQLAEAGSLVGATMPDGTRLKGPGISGSPTFETWHATLVEQDRYKWLQDPRSLLYIPGLDE